VLCDIGYDRRENGLGLGLNLAGDYFGGSGIGCGCIVVFPKSYSL
jgi:hypothetical protein